jgi:hypothetical protein
MCLQHMQGTYPKLVPRRVVCLHDLGLRLLCLGHLSLDPAGKGRAASVRRHVSENPGQDQRILP